MTTHTRRLVLRPFLCSMFSAARGGALFCVTSQGTLRPKDPRRGTWNPNAVGVKGNTCWNSCNGCYSALQEQWFICLQLRTFADNLFAIVVFIYHYKSWALQLDTVGPYPLKIILKCTAMALVSSCFINTFPGTTPIKGGRPARKLTFGLGWHCAVGEHNKWACEATRATWLKAPRSSQKRTKQRVRKGRACCLWWSPQYLQDCENTNYQNIQKLYDVVLCWFILYRTNITMWFRSAAVRKCQRPWPPAWFKSRPSLDKSWTAALSPVARTGQQPLCGRRSEREVQKFWPTCIILSTSRY